MRASFFVVLTDDKYSNKSNLVKRNATFMSPALAKRHKELPLNSLYFLNIKNFVFLCVTSWILKRKCINYLILIPKCRITNIEKNRT